MIQSQFKQSNLSRRRFAYGVAAAGALLIGGVANAQDNSSDANISSHSGFYFGGALGAAFDAGSDNVTTTGFNSQTAANAKKDFSGSDQTAGTIGIIGGYRRKLDSMPIIMGLEADISYVGQVAENQDKTVTPATGATAPAGTYRFQQDNGANYLGSIRSHLGYTQADWEAYVSGGFAYGGNTGMGSGTVTYTSPTGVDTSLTGKSTSKSKTGSVIGAGFAKGFGDNLIWRVEYIRYMFKGENKTYTSPSSQSYKFDQSNSSGHFSVVRFAILKQF